MLCYHVIGMLSDDYISIVLAFSSRRAKMIETEAKRKRKKKKRGNIQKRVGEA